MKFNYSLATRTVGSSFARSKRMRFFTCGARQRIDRRSEGNH